jgi:biotin-dependent carboxylase-like uncharacterized protein
MIEVLSNSALATIQDLGRQGYYSHGVSRSGAMDAMAVAVGNALLGNERSAAAVEIPMLPFSVQFHADMDIAIMGADCQAQLDDQKLPPGWAIHAQAGQILKLSAPRSGCRAYICVGGGVAVDEVLGSRSTQLREQFGGVEGRMLKKGDRLTALRKTSVLPEGGMGIVPLSQLLPLGQGDAVAVRVLPAAEYGLFQSAGKQALWDAEWTVTPQSNRAGYRLAGPELQLTAPVELRSHGVVPGVIQVPPGGQPIIQLADAATMGGYPKIGTVIEADLWRLAQARPGERLKFIEVEYLEAVGAAAELETCLQSIEAMAARVRSAAQGWCK